METASTYHLKGYELRERIGAGGFGAVYKAYQTTVGREVAIKIILPGLANQPDFIRRFESEAQLVARLEHPHITPLYDYWRDPEGAYLVMRWLRGGSLRDALRNGAFELRAVATILDQIAGALSLAHRSGVIHRDLKPANILLDEDGNAYLSDFGIAKDLNLPNSSTQSNAIIGSLDYISPEQARSESVTPRTDIYSLGVTLFELITGHHPFENISSVERLYKHINDPLPKITKVDAALQDAVNRVIQKATAKNPQHRYPDALVMAADFREAVDVTRTQSSLVEVLTQREQEILNLIIEGLSNKEIAQRLTVTLSTVKWYVNHIYSKLGVHSRMQAIVRARELNLVVKTTEPADQTVIPSEEFLPENPYRGLRAFQTADYQKFFGREKITAKLIKRLAERGEYSRFLAIVGPSGSGKSSLVKAGLIPALWRGDLPGSEKWFVAEMIPSSHPLDELEISLTRVAGNQAVNLNEQLRRDERGLMRVAGLILPDDGTELVIIIDQFEEVFTLCDDDETRRHFLELLYAAVTEAHSRVRVIITLRADFYDRPLNYAHFGELVHSRLETIMPLSAEELERAITKPAEQVGMTFEPGLVTAIIADVNYQPSALPLLQYALTELFEQRRGRQITREAYQAIGGTVGAVAKRADEIYLALDDAGKKAAHQMFLRLVTLGEGTEDTRRRTPQSELLALSADPEVMDEVIDAFASYRLLSLDRDPLTRAPTVEVAHEAILRQWERLRLWINDSREDIKTQQELAHITGEWLGAGSDVSFLAGGLRLERFERWAKETAQKLTPKERAFLEASLAERARQTDLEQVRQVRERRLEQRAQGFLRGLVVVFLLAALISLGLALFAFSREAETQTALASEEIARQNAEASADYARSIALAAAAKSAHLSHSPDQAIVLALAANTASENPPAFAQSVLYQTAFAPATRRLLRGADSARLSPDGSGALSWKYGENTVTYWDIETGQIVYQTAPLLEDGAVADIQFSHTSETAWIAVNSTPRYVSDAIIEIETASGREIRRLSLPGGARPTAFSLALSPDGRILLTSSIISPPEEGAPVEDAIAAFDTVSGSVIRQFAETPLDRPYELWSLSFSADGRQVAAGYGSGAVILWDVTSGEPIRTFEGLTDGIDDLHITSEGVLAKTYPAGALAEALTLWDIETGTLLRQQVLNTFGNETALHPDGHSIAITLAGAPVTILDLQTWETTREFYGHGSIQYTANFSADGRWLLTGSVDDELRLWNMEDGSEIRRMSGLNSAQLVGLIRSPDDRTVLTQQLDGPLALWDLQTGAMLRQWGRTNKSFTGTAFSPDSRYVVSGTSEDENLGTCPPPEARLTLWDAATGAMIWEVETGGNATTGKAFINGGTQIATVDRWCGNNVTIWDAATGQRVAEWEGHQKPAWGLAASPDGNTLMTASEDQTAIIWDAATGTILQTLPHEFVVRTGAFSPDSRRLVTVTNDGMVHLWDTADWREIKQMSGHSSSILYVQFSPDGRYIVSSGRDNTVFVWDVQIGEAVRQFDLPSVGTWGHAVTFSPDGHSLYMNVDNTVIRQIDLMLEPGELLGWIENNRYVRELTCSERTLYDLEPDRCAEP